MKKAKRICGLLLTFTLALFVLGCGSVKKEILGKWFTEIDPDKRTYVEFFSDNTFVTNESSATKGTWTILDDGRLKMESQDEILVGEIKIEGDKMFLWSEGQETSFVRAK
tara:strand:+ start:474 stop:803 length:330 start_codon:yes stop_codon:yes gene_type:complete